MDRKNKLSILPQAQAELEEIARVYKSLSGPNYARKITDEIYDALGQLVLFPMSGPMVQDEQLAAAGYRYILVKKYLIFYRAMGDTVFIYHIAHGTTNYPGHLRSVLR